MGARYVVTLGRSIGLVLLGVVMSQVSGCTEDPPKEQPVDCLVDANCDDANPCTMDECSSQGTCVRTPVANGPLPGQTAGDCRRDECLDGTFASTNDDADIQVDGDPCTTDACSAGQTNYAPAPDGTMCMLGGSAGVCMAGACSPSCTTGAPCDDQNPCTDDFCNTVSGACVYMPLNGFPTPGVQPVPGDCKQNICDNGVDVVMADEADIPMDGNSCTMDVCTAGVPSNPNVSAGTYCTPGAVEVCDGNGKCVECVQSSDCVMIPGGGFCVDNKCCETPCDGFCQACVGTLTGFPDGTCHFIVMGKDPDNECPGLSTCDGFGMCQ
jgi:hypothetical protein